MATIIMVYSHVNTNDWRIIYKCISLSHLPLGGQEGVLLFSEDSPILSLALDTTNNTESLWVATTNTYINKWSVDPNLMVEADSDMVNGEGSEEDLMITDVDEPTPLFTKPISTLPG